MAESIRERVKASIVTALEGIRETNGYRMTIPKSKLFLGDTLPREYPALVLTFGNEQREEAGFDLAQYLMPFTVECWVDETDGHPSATVELLLADVRQAMQALINQPANDILDLEDLGAGAPIVTESDPNRAVVSATFEVHYRHQRSNPSTP